MHSEPGRVRGRSARHRLLIVLGGAIAGLVLAASCRLVRSAASEVDAERPAEARALVAKATPASAPMTTAPATTAPAPTMPRELFILSDSVIVGGAFAIPAALPGWRIVIDGKPSRMIAAGVDQLRSRRAELGSVVL